MGLGQNTAGANGQQLRMALPGADSIAAFAPVARPTTTSQGRDSLAGSRFLTDSRVGTGDQT